VTTLVLLAAGLATRYGAAKQLAAVGPSGERLFDFAVFDAMRAGCSRVVFVIRSEQRAAFEQEVVPQWTRRVTVELAEQRLDNAPAEFRGDRTKPWGTAHALLSAAPHIPESAIVCNADDWYGASAYAAVLTSLAEDPAVHVLAGYPLASTLSEHGGVSRAVCRADASGLLQHIDERTGITRQDETIRDDKQIDFRDDALVSMNLWGFHRSFLAQLESAFHEFLASTRGDTSEFRIPDVVNGLLQSARTRVRVLRVHEEWFGLTFAGDLPRVRAAIADRIRAGQYPANLFASD